MTPVQDPRESVSGREIWLVEDGHGNWQSTAPGIGRRYLPADDEDRHPDSLPAGQPTGPYVVAVTRRRFVVRPVRDGFEIINVARGEEIGWTIDRAEADSDAAYLNVRIEDVVDRKAFVSLDHAKPHARAEVSRNWPENRPWDLADPILGEITALPSEGGTVRLPDGTTITVEQTTALALFQAARRGPEHRGGVTVIEQAVAAYNDATRGGAS